MCRAQTGSEPNNTSRLHLETQVDNGAGSGSAVGGTSGRRGEPHTTDRQSSAASAGAGRVTRDRMSDDVRVVDDPAFEHPVGSMPVGDGTVTAVRRREVAKLLDVIRAWAGRRREVRAVGIGGSWARGDPRQDSDVDIVVLTDSITAYTVTDGWIAELGAIAIVRTQQWGSLTERRLALGSGLEVEFGVVLPTWASIAPLDPGTRGVVADGFEPVYDPNDIIAALVSTVAAHPATRYEAAVADALARVGARVTRRREEHTTMVARFPAGAVNVTVCYVDVASDATRTEQILTDAARQTTRPALVVTQVPLPDTCDNKRGMPAVQPIVTWTDPTDDHMLRYAVSRVRS